MSHTRMLFLVPLLFLSVSAADAARVHPLLRRILESDQPARAVPQALRGVMRGSQEKAAQHLGVWVRTRDLGVSLEAAGLLPPGEPAPIRTARWTIPQLRAAIEDPSVEAVSPAVRCRPSLDVSIVETKAALVHEPSGDPPTYAGLTGEGVIIGIVDSGIDLDHEDFIDRMGGTRIISVWDQTVASTDWPRNFNYGKEWTADQIDSGLATQTDDYGHGTHVAGIAAGDGSATGNGEPAYRYVGMAPRSALVIVNTDFLTTSITDGVSYVFQKADSLDMPAIVNLSLGTHQCPHDGTDEFALAINSLTGPGRIVVAAAGNEAGDGIHAERAVPSPGSSTISFVIPPYTAHGGAFNDEVDFVGWFPGGANLSFTVITPNGRAYGPVHLGAQPMTESTTEGTIYVENFGNVAPNGDHEVVLLINDGDAGVFPPADGTWQIQIEATPHDLPGSSVEFDIWNYYSSIDGVRFFLGVDESELVGTPATGDSVIAVGAYVTKRSWTAQNGWEYGYDSHVTVGDIADFSSIGPRRDGVQKPEVTAPGMGIGSARSSNATYGVTEILEDGVHVISQGTSMAAPHVAGLVALMFEELGPLSVRETIARLTTTGRGDGWTGSIPNPTWGFGKIDAVEASGYVVPVTLIAASATQSGDCVDVRFVLAEDAGRDPFPVWRQDPGTVTRRMAGWSSSGRERTFLDSNLSGDGEYLYWLRYEEWGGTEWIGPARVSYRRPRLLRLQVGPNPFHGSAQIAWRIGSSPADVTIHDILGRRVRTLLLPHHVEQGVLTWDGTDARGGDLPAGLYLIRLRDAGDSVVERKVLRIE